MRYTFPEGARLNRSEEFRTVYRHGGRLKVFPLRIYYLKRPQAHTSRLGLAVGKKTGPAAVRNRWKRLVREAFRARRHLLSPPCDIIVSVSWGAGKEHMGGVEEAFMKAISILNGID